MCARVQVRVPRAWREADRAGGSRAACGLRSAGDRRAAARARRTDLGAWGSRWAGLTFKVAPPEFGHLSVPRRSSRCTAETTGSSGPDGPVTAYEYIVSGGQFVALVALAVTVAIHFWKERGERQRTAQKAEDARQLAADQVESERILAARLETLHYIISSNRSEVLTEARRVFASKHRDGEEALKSCTRTGSRTLTSGRSAWRSPTSRRGGTTKTTTGSTSTSRHSSRSGPRRTALSRWRSKDLQPRRAEARKSRGMTGDNVVFVHEGPADVTAPMRRLAETASIDDARGSQP